jgi:hypothetical protein
MVRCLHCCRSAAAAFADVLQFLTKAQRESELWIRAPEIALRLATVLAVFRGSKVVEQDDLEWGTKLARLSTTQLARGLHQHMLEDYEQADLVEHIREEFVLLSLAVRPHVFRRHQPGIVTKRLEPTAQMMCTDAGFHSDQARRHVGEPRFHLAARPLLSQRNRQKRRGFQLC